MIPIATALKQEGEVYIEYVAFVHLILGGGRDGIFELLSSPGIDSKESIPPAYVAWRAGTTTLYLLGSQPP